MVLFLCCVESQFLYSKNNEMKFFNRYEESVLVRELSEKEAKNFILKAENGVEEILAIRLPPYIKLYSNQDSVLMAKSSFYMPFALRSEVDNSAENTIKYLLFSRDEFMSFIKISRYFLGFAVSSEENKYESNFLEKSVQSSKEKIASVLEIRLEELDYSLGSLDIIDSCLSKYLYTHAIIDILHFELVIYCGKVIVLSKDGSSLAMLKRKEGTYLPYVYVPNRRPIFYEDGIYHNFTDIPKSNLRGIISKCIKESSLSEDFEIEVEPTNITEMFDWIPPLEEEDN